MRKPPREPYPYFTLDLAHRTGWAYQVDRGAPVQWGYVQLPSTGVEVGPFLDAYETWLVGMLERLHPGTVAYEAPIIRAGKKKDGKPAQNIWTARKLIGLANHTELLCYRHRLGYWQGNVSSVKKHYTGNGRADPVRHVAFRCRQLGVDVGNDGDAAMAVALLSWMVSKLDPDQASENTFGIEPAPAPPVTDANFNDPLAF